MGTPDPVASKVDACLFYQRRAIWTGSHVREHVIDLRQLRYFTLVADVGSIARASAHLGVAAPAISRAIAALEQDLGSRLFDRDGRGMRLTIAGERLRGRASQILRDVELARQEAVADTALPAGKVSIGTTPAAAALIGAALIQRLQAETPQVKPRVLEGYSGYLQNWVLTGEVDFALANGFEPNARMLTHRSLATEHLVAVGSPVRSSDPIALADLLDGPLILPSATNPTRGLIDAAAKGLGRSVHTRLDVDSATLLKDLAAAGFGVAILPYAAAAREIRDGRLTARAIIEPEIPCELNLIFRRDRPPNRLAEFLIDKISELLDEHKEDAAAPLR